jgi:hypothetical protein
VVEFRNTQLKSKVFKSYVKREEFKKLKQTILTICCDKYHSNLKIKSVKGLHGYTKESIRLRGLLNVHKFKYERKLMQKVFICFYSTMG